MKFTTLMLVVSLSVLPIASYAEFKVDKIEMINKAIEHRKALLLTLKEINRISIFIPDLEKREHLKAVLAGAIASTQAKDLRTKILAVGLPLIADLVCDSLEKYQTLRTLMLEADYHFEMYQFYNEISLQATHKQNTNDRGTQAYIKAIDYMTLCIILAQSTGKEYTSLVYQLEINREQILNSKKNLGEQAALMYENLLVDLSELEISNHNQEIRDALNNYYSIITENLKQVDEYWE